MHVYHCEECNKPFAGIGGLRIHKRKHMPLYRRNKAKVKSLTNGRNLYIWLNFLLLSRNMLKLRSKRFLFVLASTTVACKICKEKIEKKLIASHIKVGRYLVLCWHHNDFFLMFDDVFSRVYFKLYSEVKSLFFVS